MRRFARAGVVFGFLPIGAAVLTSSLSASRVDAQSGESGNVCVHAFAPGVACSGSDLRAEALEAISVHETCAEGVPGSALVVFDAVLSAVGSPSTFDANLTLALDGNSALSGGSCYHDYLQPPLTTTPVYGDADSNGVPDLVNGPWADLEPGNPPDDCGDVEGGTELFKTLATPSIPLRVDCVDSDEDGWVDVSVCTAWRSGSSPNPCAGLSDATPSSGVRCHCDRLNLIGLPEPHALVALLCGALGIAGLARARRQGSAHRRG